jgi:hypothetical protein
MSVSSAGAGAFSRSRILAGARDQEPLQEADPEVADDPLLLFGLDALSYHLGARMLRVLDQGSDDGLFGWLLVAVTHY